MKGTLAAQTGAYAPIALAMVCSGCAQLFGIDETSSSNASISIQVQRVSVGASVITTPLEVGATPPAFVVEDSKEPSGVRRVPASLVEPGKWSAPLKKVEAVVFTPPDGLPRVLMFPDFVGAAISANHVAYEHPNPLPAPPPSADLSISVPLPTTVKAGESFSIAIPGAWVRHDVTPNPEAAAASLNRTIPYTAFASYVGGRIGQFTSQDTVTVLRHENRTLTGQLVVQALDQSTGTTLISGAMAAVIADTPFNAALSASAVATRFTSQVPPPTSAVTQGWRIEASPGFGFGLPAGVLLADGGIAPTDTAITANYGNPFPPQWRATVNYVASASRTTSVNGATATLNTNLQTIAEAGTGLPLDMPVGLPTEIAINTMPLHSDGMTVALDVDKQVTVDITADRSQNTMYQITLVDLAVVDGQVTQTPQVVVSGIGSRLFLPPNSLQTGHTYTVQIRCIAGGYPNAATGDLQTFALPVSYGYQDGAVFTVIPAGS